MMEETNANEKDKRKGWVISFATHAVILILALLPFLQYEDPPPGQQGVLVSFGAPDMGRGDDRPDTQQEEEVVPEPPSEEEVVEEEEVEEPVEEVVEEEVAPVEEVPEPTPDIPEEVVTKDEPDVVAIQKEKGRRRAKEDRKCRESEKG